MVRIRAEIRPVVFWGFRSSPTSSMVISGVILPLRSMYTNRYKAVLSNSGGLLEFLARNSSHPARYWGIFGTSSRHFGGGLSVLCPGRSNSEAQLPRNPPIIGIARQEILTPMHFCTRCPIDRGESYRPVVFVGFYSWRVCLHLTKLSEAPPAPELGVGRPDRPAPSHFRGFKQLARPWRAFRYNDWKSKLRDDATISPTSTQAQLTTWIRRRPIRPPPLSDGVRDAFRERRR